MSDPNGPSGPPPPPWQPPPPPAPGWQPPSQGPPSQGPPPSGPPPGWGPPPPYGAYPGPPPAGPPRRSRLPLVLGAVAAVLVVAAAVTVPLVLADDEPDERGAGTAPSTATDTATDTASPTDEPATLDLSEVEVYEDLPTTHTEEPVDYEQTPPVGGPHFPAWLECGVYDEPVPDELAVHDLEHGTFWFAYDAGALDESAVAALAEQLPDNGIMAPYDGLDAPVVVTVWERQLVLTGPDDPRLALFLDEYAAGETAPEPGASCAGGLTLEQADDALGIETF